MEAVGQGRGQLQELPNSFLQLGFESGRMKTGTPPRIDGRSIDYSKLEEQKGDDEPGKFSYSKETAPLTKQRSCYLDLYK